MLAIICPICGTLNRLGIDDDTDCEVCASCGCNYGELEDEVAELH